MWGKGAHDRVLQDQDKTERLLVESDGGAEKGVDDVGVVVKLLVDHEGKDAHLGGTAVVELDSRHAVKVEGADGRGREVALVLLTSLDDVLLAKAEAELDEADESDDLSSASGGDGLESSKAGLHLREGKSGGDVTSAADAGGGHNVADNGEHGDAAVLGLDVTEAVEFVLVSIGKEAKGIPKAKGSLSTDFGLKRHLEGAGARRHAGGGCERRGAHERSNNDKSTEHFYG
jgi:hypothetical protein